MATPDPPYFSALKGEYGITSWGIFKNYKAKYIDTSAFRPVIHVMAAVCIVGYMMEFPHLRRKHRPLPLLLGQSLHAVASSHHAHDSSASPHHSAPPDSSHMSSPLTLLVLASLLTPSRRAPLGAAQACARRRPPLDRSRGRLCQSADVSLFRKAPCKHVQSCAASGPVRREERLEALVSRSLNRILMYHAVGKRYSGARDRIMASACSRVNRLSNKQLE